jgi:superfamily II DNA or RNA helicase
MYVNLASQKVRIKKKFKNEELLYFNYFEMKTKIIPENVIIYENFIFFFVRSEDYFNAKRKLGFFRNQFNDKKVLIIRAEKTLIKLIFGFFPDVTIHDIEFLVDDYSDKTIVNVFFYTYEERAIAIGRKGEYIKVLNSILNDYLFPIKISCKAINFFY